MSPNRKLLRDLGELAARYRPSDWEELASWLDDPTRRETLGVLLKELSEASRSRGPKKKSARKKSPRARVESRLESLRSKDPGRGRLLEEIWAKLKSKELLPSLPTVRAFADGMGLKGIEASRRETAIAELMDQLLDIPGESLEDKMRETVVGDRQLADEYEHWVDLILNGSSGDQGQAQASPPQQPS